ncbi:glycosyltransferase [Nocardioides anomalus]|uniref:Glycosyltransferase n=1 Tax=Nocardioides anomalus TaxID=2712223 RepID=A0A6G6WDY5_9ACTN|nr:glycosyltransferase [Nocardioides anomalus]QIG43363.1 glycosyltransferase [Nocardioides anomalus]
MSLTEHARHPSRPAAAGSRLDVVHVIATLTPGGAERQLEMLTARSRHRTRVIVLYESGGIAESMRAAGEPVEELQSSGWRKALLPLTLARRLRRLRPDVVHVHLLSAQVMALPAARLARVPVVVSTEHSLMEDTLEGRPHTWWLRLLYQVLERLTTHTVAVSAVTAHHLRQWGVHLDRISVVDLGIDFEAVAYDAVGRQRVRRELAIGPDTLVVGAVGRLEGQKRIDIALRACAPLLRDGAVLVVAGAGPLLAELRSLAGELGVADQVHWLGSRPRMGEVYGAMDVLLSASADESFGMAVVEAVGSGLPVVHAACPALEELPELPQVSHVRPSGDATVDAERLGDALAASSAAFGQRRWPAPAVLLEAYGAQAAADRVDAVYDRLPARHRG